MTRRVSPPWGAAIALAVCVTGATAETEIAPVVTQPATTVPDAGFWPTQRMMKLVLQKGAKGIIRQYKLDDAQAAALEENLLTQYPAMMNRHRAVLQSLFNEVLEMQLAGETPTAERVAKFAGELEPVLADARRTLKGTYDEMVPRLRPEQRRKWDGDYLKIWAGLSVAEAKLQRWKQGLFKPEEWPLPAADGNRGKGATSAPAGQRASDDESGLLGAPLRLFGGGAGGLDDDRRDVPLDQWQAYVKRFIRQHKLDKAQANQAMAILKEIRQRAEAVRKQNRDRFNQINRELPRVDRERRAKLKADLDELRAPLRDLFDELQTRLGDVLRSDQR